MAIELDDSSYPLIVVRFGADWTSQDFSDYLARYRALLLRRQLFAAVFDATKARAASASERRLQAEQIKELEPILRKHCAGVAFAIPSAVIRGVLTAIFWIQPPVYEHTIVPSTSEAMAWARQRLARHEHAGRSA